MHSLLPYNTFHVPAHTDQLIIIDEHSDLSQILAQYQDIPKLIIGGGSNMLLVNDRPGVTIINQIHGRQIIHEDEQSTTIKLGAGESWHETVMRSVQQGYRGMENLALIPGTVGAAPIQNIGAYGSDASHVITSIEYYDIIDDGHKTLSHNECKFGYRDSIFKHNLKDKALITSVTITLSKSPKPMLIYEGLKEKIQPLEVSGSLLKSLDIAQAVIQIRSSKLPDRTQVGTAGSFFKNPIINKVTLDQLLDKYPNCPHRDLGNDNYKIPAGRLLDHILGARGQTTPDGKVGCWHSQALVLVNHGGATGQQVRDRAQYLIDECKQKIGIILEPEINII